MNKALFNLLPDFLSTAIARAEKAGDTELMELLRDVGRPALESMLAGMGDARIQAEKEDRAHFVARLAAILANGRPVALPEVPELVRVANAIAAEALFQCGAADHASGTDPGLPSDAQAHSQRIKPYRGIRPSAGPIGAPTT